MRKQLALYVHIPFCVKKCNYCDFLSGPADRESKANYVQALLYEIRSYRELAKDYVVKSIFIGGGTPSSIDANDIAHIMTTIREVFTIAGCEIMQDATRLSEASIPAVERGFASEPEITIEINPGTVTEDKLKTYYEAGINRISFGLQSTNDEELKMLGRIHTYEQFLANYDLARKVGFRNINIDLMSALPGQTVESYQVTLDRILALQPEHISAYSLIIEEGTPFYEIYGEEYEEEGEAMTKYENASQSETECESKSKSFKKLPSEDDERQMYENTRAIFHEHGYERYEISNFAKAGYECKHNCTYWRRGDYLGLGTGASSLIQNERFHNIEDLQSYIKLADCSDYRKQDEIENLGEKSRKLLRYHNELHQDVENLSIPSQMEEFMFLGLRMMNGISISEFSTAFDQDIFAIYGDIIQKLMEEELLVQEEDRIYLSPRGIDISNYVMSEFMLEE